MRGLIRNPQHAADLEAFGAEPVICDMEQEEDLSRFVEDADAVVFAAGAGPGSGPERKRTVDLGAAVKLMEAGVPRYVMVSAMGAGDPSSGPEQMRPYLEAKAEADEKLAGSDLEWTIVRPGGLTDEGSTGKVKAGPRIGRGEITRADTAAVLAEVLRAPNTIGKTFNVVNGDKPIADAISSL